MKRTERHHLKEDEMQHGVHWLVVFYEKYRREIFLVAGAVLLAVLIFAGLLLIRSRARAVESQAVGEVTALAADLDQNPGNLAALEKLAAQSRTARLANLELATHWAEKSDWAKADSYLTHIPASPKDLLFYQAQDLRAQVAIGRKDFDAAIAIYKKITEEKPKAYPMDAAVYHLAQAQELKGQIAAAVELYKKVQADYPQSYYGYEASMKAGKLEIRK
jgi:predicted negative regulator of RcsB-dependent stress response